MNWNSAKPDSSDLEKKVPFQAGEKHPSFVVSSKFHPDRNFLAKVIKTEVKVMVLYQAASSRKFLKHIIWTRLDSLILHHTLVVHVNVYNWRAQAWMSHGGAQFGSHRGNPMAHMAEISGFAGESAQNSVGEETWPFGKMSLVHNWTKVYAVAKGQEYQTRVCCWLHWDLSAVWWSMSRRFLHSLLMWSCYLALSYREVWMHTSCIICTWTQCFMHSALQYFLQDFWL